MPTSAAPPSSLKKYFFSPSGAVMTCWSLAVCEPAALLNESLEFSLSWTCVAHSSERNFTPTSSSSFATGGRSMPPAANCRVRQPASHEGRFAPCNRAGLWSVHRSSKGRWHPHLYEFATIALLGLAVCKLVDWVGTLGPLSRTATITLA